MVLSHHGNRQEEEISRHLVSFNTAQNMVCVGLNNSLVVFREWLRAEILKFEVHFTKSKAGFGDKRVNSKC